jgi:hypothetical protein
MTAGRAGAPTRDSPGGDAAGSAADLHAEAVSFGLTCSGSGREEARGSMDALRSGDPGSVGGYRLLGRLGAGGMGQVFLGVSPGGRKVAVKLIHEVHGGTAEFRERFAREIEAAQRVGGFHTAPVVDADPHADPPWMVTAYIEGPSLQQAVGQDGPLPPGRVRALGAGLAEGLWRSARTASCWRSAIATGASTCGTPPPIRWPPPSPPRASTAQ